MIIKLMLAYAKAWIGVPYKWGGDSPKGVDCSGFVQLVLQKVGLDPAGDQTAQSLYNHFLKIGSNPLTVPVEGALIFFGRNTRSITHVSIALSATEMVEAGGGGSKTTTYDDAVKDNAWVRQRLVASRRDVVAILMLNYKKGELMS